MAALPDDYPDTDLLTRFTALVDRACGRVPHGGGGPLGAELLARWSEPRRRYHTTQHLRDVLARLDELADQPTDPDAVELAAWFHDAVHDPDPDPGAGPDPEAARPGNEERSARLAEQRLPAAGLAADRTAEVARLVRLTAGHDPAEGDANGAALCDADLGVLAGSPEEYAAYAAAVRQEYGHLSDAVFRAGRAAVLRRLLDRPRLFHTPYGAARWEATARFNVGGELELLTR